MRAIKITLLLAALCLIGIASSAEAQIVYGQPSSGGTNITYTHWKIDPDGGDQTTINQFVIPISGFIPLQDNLEMRFQAAQASHSATIGGDDSKLSGLTDIRLQMNKSFSNDRFLASFGINLPSGKRKLNFDEELNVMGLLSENYLIFPVRQLGEGFGFNMLFGGATSSGNARLGATAMFQYNGKYTPYDGGGKYDPGEMFSLSASADTKSDKAMYSANAIFSVFTDDKLDGEKARKSSTQLDFLAGMQFPGQTMSFFGNVRVLLRGRNTTYNPDESISEQLRLYGNEFTIGAGLRYHPDKLWSLTPSVELRTIGANEYETDDALYLDGSMIFGLGAAFARNLGQDVNGTLGFKYYSGSANGGDISLSGYQLTVGLRAAF